MAPQRKPTATMDASAAVRASNAFPSGLYGKYKRATDFFLHWLLRTRSSGGSNSKKHKKQRKQSVTTLDVYEHIVKEIVLDPTALPPELLQLWRRALAACETAITLRARVALFFAGAAELEAQGGDHDSHAHFLERLRSWLAMLQQVTPRVVVLVSDEARVKPEAVVDFANFYSVLELPDDYFSPKMDVTNTKEYDPLVQMDTQSKDPTTTARTASKRQNHRTRRVLADDNTGDNEFYVELSFFFMELEELLEAVHNAFLDVKHQKKTLLEATVITKVAVDCAVNVITRLELRHPWIRSCDDVMAILDDVMLTPGFKTLWDAVLAGWSTSPEEENAKSSDNQGQGECRHPKFVPGSIVVDFVWVSKIVKDFVAAIPSSNKDTTTENTKQDVSHDEEHHIPRFAWPSMAVSDPFFDAQLRLLYEELRDDVDDGPNLEQGVLRAWFMNFFSRLITTRTVTLACVFLVICWARSVAVLESDGALRRTVGLSIMQCWNLEERLTSIMIHPLNIDKANPSEAEIDELFSTARYINESTTALRANPLLAGCEQIDQLLVFQYHSTLKSFAACRVLAFAHCYHALLDRQFLAAIPIVEDFLRIYEPLLFEGSRRAAFHRSYVKSYLKSMGGSELVEPMLHHRLQCHRRERLLKKVVSGLVGFSRISLLLCFGEYSILPAQSTVSESWKTLLETVSDLCADEVFGSRVLSRDLFKLPEVITSASHAVSEVVKPLLDGFPLPGQGTSHALATDETASLLLLVLLDRPSHEQATDHYCRLAAHAISQHFAPADEKFFVYPQIRGHAADNQKDRPSEPDSSQAAFDDLMEMLAHSQGPLPDDDFNRLKEAVAKDPTLLRMRSKDTTQELCTLLHHAAAGPAHDRRLLKWLVQAEAFEQMNPISFKPADESTEVPLLDMTALHCAAKAGLVEMVRLLLEAGLMLDLNTVTAHSQESLAHLAAKHRHRELFQYLVSEDADLSRPNAAGLFVSDLLKRWQDQQPATADMQHWQALRSANADLQREKTAIGSSVRTKDYKEVAADSRRSLDKYCDEKRAARLMVSESSEGIGADGETKEHTTKKNDKKKKKKATKKKKSEKATELSVHTPTGNHAAAMKFIQQRLL